MAEHLRTEILEELNDAWLNINVNNEDLIRPLDLLKTDDPDDFYKSLTYLLTTPEYFCFICKYILNIELLPFQGLILQELWERKFPMLIATRGGSKTWLLSLYALLRTLLTPNCKVVVVGAAFRQSKFLHEYMENIWNNAPILRDLCDPKSGPRRDIDMCRMIINGSTATAIPVGTGEKIRGLRANYILCVGKETLIQTDKGLIEIKNYLDGESYHIMNQNKEFEKPSHLLITDPTDVYEIKTVNGFSFRCSNVHQVMTTNGWKKAIDLTKEDCLVIDSNDYFPDKIIKNEGATIDDNMGWLLGLLVSEGTLSNRNYINIINTDKKLIDQIKNTIKYDWKEYYKKPHKDSRGFDCRESWTIQFNCTDMRESLYKLGVDYSIHKDKTIPSCILKSPRSVIVKFISGLFEGDGTALQYEDSRGGRQRMLRVAYYSRSKKLCQQLQILLLKFSIYGCICSRKSKLSVHPQWMLSFNGRNALSLYNLLNVSKWKLDNSNLTITYRSPRIRKNGNRYTVSTNANNKNIHIGTYDDIEQCHIAFNEYWNTTNEAFRVKLITKLPDQEVLYDFHMPETHSFIGNGFIQHNCDEFASVPREIFENVIAGFASVSSSPAEGVKLRAAKKRAIEMGMDPSTLDEKLGQEKEGNQIVISGTAYYDFNHFAEYWKRWRSIIHSKGDNKKLGKIFKGEVPDAFNWKDYSIIRLPVDLLPKGFMDEGQVARSKATIHNGIFEMEFGGIFSTDSAGFFKRSLIENCTGTDIKPIKLPTQEVYFDPLLKGNLSKQHIIGVDPASEIDNFSIIVLEINEDHRRIVHCWTTTRQRHKDRLKLGLTEEQDFYGYCARKIRDLMGAFPTVHVAMDAQGGGIAVSEALHDGKRLLKGEIPIWPTIDENKEKDTDDEQGLHILEMCQFAKYDWLSEANHGMRKDFEDKVLLFPRFDPITIGLSIEQDKISDRTYDTLEDCVMEIEALKDELCLIEISQTALGKERWDSPEVKIGVGKKERLRKDRYSALLMANMAARQTTNRRIQEEYEIYGGFADGHLVKRKGGDENSFIGPNWFVDGIKDVY